MKMEMKSTYQYWAYLGSLCSKNVLVHSEWHDIWVGNIHIAFTWWMLNNTCIYIIGSVSTVYICVEAVINQLVDFMLFRTTRVVGSSLSYSSILHILYIVSQAVRVVAFSFTYSVCTECLPVRLLHS